LATLAALSHPAWAQSSPYFIGVRQAFAHNSNLFKTPDGQPIAADKYSSTGLLAGVNQLFGRQHFHADGSIQTDRYEDFTELNNVSYTANVGLEWQTIEHLSGSLRYSSLRSLADYGGPDSPQIREKNLQDTRQFVTDVRYGITRRLALQAGYEHRSLDYSAAAYADREYTQNIGSFGVRYGLPDLLVWGLGYRYTKGKTPNAITDPVLLAAGTEPEDRSSRKDIDLTVSWMPSALSTLNARISSSREDHSQNSIADVSAVTGSLGWIYRPTGKLQFDTALSRDTGTETTFAAVSSGATPPPTQGGTTSPTTTLAAVDNNRLTNSARLSVAYELTGKIRLHAGGGYSKTSSDGGSDNSTSQYALGINYEATRAISLGCSLNRERQSNVAVGADSVYTARLASCFGQLVLR